MLEILVLEYRLFKLSKSKVFYFLKKWKKKQKQNEIENFNVDYKILIILCFEESLTITPTCTHVCRICTIELIFILVFLKSDKTSYSYSKNYSYGKIAINIQNQVVPNTEYFHSTILWFICQILSFISIKILYLLGHMASFKLVVNSIIIGLKSESKSCQNCSLVSEAFPMQTHKV